MLELVITLFLWIFAIYGIFSLIQDKMRLKSYNLVRENVKLILTVKNAEDGIENYIRELSFGKNFFNNLIIVDMDSTDDTIDILRELEDENFNLRILDKEEGKYYFDKMFKS